MLVLTPVPCASVLRVCVCVWHCLPAQVGGNRAEFYAYGLLHAASLGRGLLSQELCQLPRDILADPFISHALATVNAFRWVHGQRLPCPVATCGAVAAIALPHTHALLAVSLQSASGVRTCGWAARQVSA